MGKLVHSDVLDAAFTELATATGLCLNTAEPASRAAAISDNLMPEATPSFTGPVAGDGGGTSRKLTVNASNSNTADASGTASHVTLIDGAVVLYVTTCTSQAVSSGNTVNIGSWDVEIGTPT